MASSPAAGRTTVRSSTRAGATTRSSTSTTTTLAQRAKADPGTFIPLSVVDPYQTPTVPQPNLPVTRAGHTFAHAGISPTTVNDVMRSLAAKGEQVFLLIGMLGLLLSKRRRGTVGREYYYLCAAAIAVLVAVTVLPDLSVEYGVLRVFQQALILVAPVIVVGSLTLFQPLGRWWRQALAGGLGLAFFASTTGLIPQALGGYPAQLNLNDSGQYYDLYYMTPQQQAAVNWLDGKPAQSPRWGAVRLHLPAVRLQLAVLGHGPAVPHRSLPHLCGEGHLGHRRLVDAGDRERIRLCQRQHRDVPLSVRVAQHPEERRLRRRQIQGLPVTERATGLHAGPVTESVATGLALAAALVWFGCCLVGSFHPDRLARPSGRG